MRPMLVRSGTREDNGTATSAVWERTDERDGSMTP